MSISGSYDEQNFLPVSQGDLKKRKWISCDFIIVTGDAYVDHPSFGAAVIGRVLEAAGFRVGIIAQPDWKNPDAFRKLGRPELAFMITSGNLDSMVNHYSSMKKRRRSDAYSPGGKTGMRPDRAVIAYTSAVKQVYKGVPVIIGGIEASLRRLSHYDYWSNKVRRSILIDSKADLLIYGMGEKPVLECAKALAAGRDIKNIREIKGTVWRSGIKDFQPPENSQNLPSFGEVSTDKYKFAEAFRLSYENNDPFTARALIQKTDQQYIVQNPPPYPMSSRELDHSFELPYCRASHPDYEEAGGIPALKEVEFSLISSRGCFGSCSFCSLGFHQGRIIQPRSRESLIKEASTLKELQGFKGIIHDVGGPTANFFHASCKKQKTAGSCADRECLFPEPCPALDLDHSEYLSLLRDLRNLPGIKKVFIRSGIRFDYLMKAVNAEKKQKFKTGGTAFLEDLCRYHVSGQLKTAPEHVSAEVLRLMKKPPAPVYTEFELAFEKKSIETGKKQYIIPYLISGHPGSGLKDAIELALYLKKKGFIPDQVQDFYPTPSTLSTCMYYTGIDPFTGKKVYSAVTVEEKRMQRALLHFHKPENRGMVIKALKKAGRTDLIGRGKNCLIR